MKQYLNLLNDIMENGVDRSDRTGTGTRGVFGRQARFDLREGFPLLTTKKMFTKGIIAELLWFISGSTNKKVLQEQGVHIWDGWGNDETGELGPIYGAQWRQAPQFVIDPELGPRVRPLDQLGNAIETLKKDPYNRRIIVNSWNPGQLHLMALPPCHCLFQFFVQPGEGEEKILSLQLYQRSCDTFLGVPFNIASYALLLQMVAQVCGYTAGEFIHTYGDLHIYRNHFDQVREQMSRTPYELPRMEINPDVKNIDDFKLDDFKLVNYQHHPSIKGEVSI